MSNTGPNTNTNINIGLDSDLEYGEKRKRLADVYQLPLAGRYHHEYLVQQFHELFQHPIARTPTLATPELRELRIRLIAEELAELARALQIHLFVEVHGAHSQVSVSPDISTHRPPLNIVEAADANFDLEYVIHGANLVFGFPGHELFLEGQLSNMSKLGIDGRPIYREDGKIMKGPNYFKPDFKGILLERGWDGKTDYEV